MSDRIYTMYGRQAERSDEMADLFLQTLDLLRDLKAGKVLPSQLEVEGNGWRVNPVPEVSQNGSEPKTLVSV